MVKLMWHGNAPHVPTGYGQQAALFLPLLAERYDVGCSVNFGLEGAPIRWHNIPILPGLGQDWGNNTIVQHATRFFDGDPKGGIVLTLADVWPLEPAMAQQVNMACWCPVDHDPAPPRVKEFLAQSGAVPIAMSRFGQEQLADLDALYVPHGVDCELLKPMDKREARGGMFPDDAWVIGMVAANKGHPSRKGFSQALGAVKRLMDEHENVHLYLHTVLTPHTHGGENLLGLMQTLGIDGNRVRAADQYSLMFSPYSMSDMRRIYGAMDVLLNPAFGEGFGIPIIEAQAVGRPVITTDFTAMPELTGGGWTVSGHPYWTMLNSWQCIPLIDEIHDALEDCYGLTDHQYELLSAKARKHALNYDIRHVLREHWWPTLEEVERRVFKRAVPVGYVRDKTVSVVTPWHNHPEFQEGFQAAMVLARPDEVLVIDSGSDPPVDGAVFRYEENVGQSEACNKGLEMASGEVVVFLNNDIKPTSPDWLDAILANVGPGVLVGANLRTHNRTVIDGEPVPYLDGWCIAGMRDDFEALGAWDTTYEEPAYYGDNDLSLRAVASGFKLVEANVGLDHLSNGTSGDDPVHREDVAARNHRIYEQRVRDLRRVRSAA